MPTVPRHVCAVLVLAACGDNLPGPAPDAAADAYVDPLGRWGIPVPVFAASTTDDDDPTLTADLLELYFNRERDIYVATRATVSSPWSAPALVAELSTPSFETTPEISGDGLAIYFASDRAGGLGGLDVYVATRPARTAPWGAPQLVDALSSPSLDGAAFITADGTMAVLGSDRRANTDHDLYGSVRRSRNDPWPAPVELTVLDSPAADWSPMLSADKRTLLFVSYRSGNGDLYASHRARTADDFDPPSVIEELATPEADADPWLSPDGHLLVFSSDRDHPGTQALYVSTR